jgi:hypothetical protein
LPIAGLELDGEALRLLNGPGIQLECQFVYLNPADNGAWYRLLISGERFPLAWH